MSGSILGGFTGSAVASITNVLIRPYRAIGMIIPQVVISEMSQDEIAITAHPVEQGAPISDHAFKMPAQLIMRCGWSNSARAALPGQLFGAGSLVNQVYQALLDLQAIREPFAVFTGKRYYPDMLIQGLSTETDARTENVLLVTCRLQQVIIVSTATVQVASASNQAAPQSTAPTQSTGPVTPAQQPASLLRQGLDLLGIQPSVPSGGGQG